MQSSNRPSDFDDGRSERLFNVLADDQQPTPDIKLGDDSTPFLKESKDSSEKATPMGEPDTSFSSFKYATKTPGNDPDNESVNFLSIFEYFDWSFLVVIFITNFAQGFRRLLEFGLYYIFKDKLGL